MHASLKMVTEHLLASKDTQTKGFIMWDSLCHAVASMTRLMMRLFFTIFFFFDLNFISFYVWGGEVARADSGYKGIERCILWKTQRINKTF